MNGRGRKRRMAWGFAAVWSMLLLLLPSCVSRPSGYKGYQTRAYTVRGQTYHPMSVESALGFKESGICSWYNESRFFGLKRGKTSLGEKVMPWHLTGAHKTLPLPCMVKVTNMENGKSLPPEARTMALLRWVTSSGHSLHSESTAFIRLRLKSLIASGRCVRGVSKTTLRDRPRVRCRTSNTRQGAAVICQSSTAALWISAIFVRKPCAIAGGGMWLICGTTKG